MKNPQTISTVEETLTRTEQFLEDNYKSILYGLGVVVVVVGIVWLGKLYLGKRNEEAQSQMYQAERYLEQDSVKLALNGDGKLSWVSFRLLRTINLPKLQSCNYSAGICYLIL